QAYCMIIANTIYLWGLLGLIIPLAIHLWSKREGKIIKVGSIELFPKSESKRSKSVRLNEIALFILRISLISFLVLILADLMVLDSPSARGTILVDLEVIDDPDYNGLVDSLLSTDLEVREFQEGFPLLRESVVSKLGRSSYDYWSVLSGVDELGLDSVTIYSKAKKTNFQGRRVEGRTQINWIILPNLEQRSELVDAFVTNTETVKCLLVTSSNLKTEAAFVDVDDLPNIDIRRV
ncbi:MAG: BatA domain-containing protein, partial [Pseudomonadota bacterium]